MADGLDVGAHGGPLAAAAALIASAVTAAAARVLGARRSEVEASRIEETNVRLALIEQRLGNFTDMMKLYGELAGRLALAERDVLAAHRRLDDRLASHG